MNRTIALTFVALLVLIGAARGQEVPRAMYPLILANDAKPLPVGTLIWANFGDSPCAYPHNQSQPKATDDCMKGSYLKARIKEVFIFRGYGERHWCYTVEFMEHHLKGLTRNAYFEDAMIIVNPGQWGEYSKYFVLLNW